MTHPPAALVTALNARAAEADQLRARLQSTVPKTGGPTLQDVGVLFDAPGPTQQTAVRHGH